jgi:hypothetical protein
VRVCWLVLLAGCGRIGFDLTGDGNGPSGDGSAHPEAGSGSDGSLGIDALTSPGCGTTPILIDDFADDAIDARWSVVNTGGYQVAETGGKVQIGYPATAPASTRAGYRQAATVDFTGTCAIAELVRVPNTGVAAFAYLRLGSPTKNIEMFVEGGNLFGRFSTNGTSGTIGPKPYDAVAHRFVRIRSTGPGNYVLEAGPSLTQFTTTIGTEGGTVVDPTPGSLEIGTSTDWSMVSGGGVVEFESLIFLGP